MGRPDEAPPRTDAGRHAALPTRRSEGRPPQPADRPRAKVTFTVAVAACTRARQAAKALPTARHPPTAETEPTGDDPARPGPATAASRNGNGNGNGNGKS